MENLVLLLTRAGRQSGTVDDWNAALLGQARQGIHESYLQKTRIPSEASKWPGLLFQ